MRALLSLLVGGATFGAGVATGAAFAATCTAMCRAARQRRRYAGEAREPEPPAETG